MKRKNNHLMIINLLIKHFNFGYFINYSKLFIIYQQLFIIYMMDLKLNHSFIIFIINSEIGQIINHLSINSYYYFVNNDFIAF